MTKPLTLPELERLVRFNNEVLKLRVEELEARIKEVDR